VGDPISVTPEDENTYSFFNVATTVVRSDDTLTITFLDADINDLDNDGDTEEMPTLTWTLLETPLVEDLNACTEDETTTVENTDEGTTTETDASQAEDEDSGSSAETDPADSPTQTSPPAPPADTPEPSDSDADGSDIPFDNTDGRRPLMTRAECTGIGGTVIGDIGDGAIHRPEYRCESGEEPVARITYLEGEPIATDGEVCCL